MVSIRLGQQKNKGGIMNIYSSLISNSSEGKRAKIKKSMITDTLAIYEIKLPIGVIGHL